MPKKRLPPSKRISKQILQLKKNFEEKDSTLTSKGLLDKLLELGMKKIIQELLEEERKDFLKREYYQQEESSDGYRNGYKPGIIKTAQGKLRIEKPQVSDSKDKFQSRLWPQIKGNTEELERLAVEMYVRGCSVRDIENLLKDKLGNLLLSKTAISQLNQRLWEEYKLFIEQDLNELDVAYLFCDAVYESMRLFKAKKEGILVVWCILSDGTKRLLHIALGNKESFEAWIEIFRNLKKRGMNDPVLGTTDGALGLIEAFNQSFSSSLRQRCLVHKKLNILAKVPEQATIEVKLYLNSVYHAVDQKQARIQADILRNKFSSLYPSAVDCFNEDFEACISHLRCPVRHRKHIYSNNLIERSFLEEKRRTKIIPRFFAEKSCLALVFGTLIRTQETWRRIPMSFEEQIEIMELREKLGQKARHQEIKLDNQRKPHEKVSRKNKT